MCRRCRTISSHPHPKAGVGGKFAGSNNVPLGTREELPAGREGIGAELPTETGIGLSPGEVGAARSE